MSIFDLGAAMLRRLPPEMAHQASLAALAAGRALVPAPAPDDPRLAVRALGLDFPNPVGLAAGFDKDVRVPDAMGRLGFGFVECGTVTPRPQRGNPRPRLFRLIEDKAVINRMGFNNGGMVLAATNLGARKGKGIVGINIGANKDSADRIADYAACYEQLAPLADYVTINVSSPNTPGLRGLQNREALARLLDILLGLRARTVMRPLLLKIAPDLDDHALDDIAGVVQGSGIEGLIVSNTTIARPPLVSRNAGEAGGLSGAPLMASSTRMLGRMYRRLGGAVTLVGVGGIASGIDAFAKIQAGASLVQLYSALAFQGPSLIAAIKRDLAALVAQHGYASVAAAVGTRLPPEDTPEN